MAAKLSHRLILNEWIFSKFGYSSADEGMKDIKSFLMRVSTGWDEQNVFYFSESLKLYLPQQRAITNDDIDIYESNIFKHWSKITKKRIVEEHRDIFPLYFQYISLLFTEYYLDRITSDWRDKTNSLLEELENFRLRYNMRFKTNSDRIPEFAEGDLRKLSFWMATGSGKTLIMHCNIDQFQYYTSSKNLTRHFNKLLLITPNEGLTKQHLQEFVLSGISAIQYSKSLNQISGMSIEILEITKLEEKSGVTTVAVSEFGKNNLVMVDEGHRGSGGEKWFNKRQYLCEQGFSFEYSATFGQAVNALSGAKNKEMSDLYAKSVLMDYSYKYFYSDGFGKDFYITVLEEIESKYHTDNIQHLYLTNCLLKFYQQCKLLKEKKTEFADYLIEEPLMIFVGGTVTGKREAERDTDVISALKFFSRFVQNQSESMNNIKLLIEGRDEILENGVVNVNSFTYLDSEFPILEEKSPALIFDDILNIVFNAPGGGLLHAVYLKGGSNEVGLKIGDSSEYFGVINVGTPKSLWNMLNKPEQTSIICTEQNIAFSLFENINHYNSKIRLLVGAKKFSEGWNSWRVSSMGLINVGKKEGSQIIQLFGRGVRLKGLDFSLKRATGRAGSEAPQYLEELETLNVFGIRANYMNDFRDYIEEEEVQKDNDFETIILPIIRNISNEDLKVILPKKDMPEFKEKAMLSLKYEEKIPTKVCSDWYSRVKSLSNRFNLRSADDTNLHSTHFSKEHLQYLDLTQIYFELLHHKRKFAYYNLEISKTELENLLVNKAWYVLYIPAHLMEFDNFQKILLWKEMAVSILKAYCDKFYKYHRNLFQAPFREYRTLKDIMNSSEPSCIAFRKNLIFEYKAVIQKSREKLIINLKRIKELINNDSFSNDFSLPDFEIFNVSKHLYNPLIYVAKGAVEIKVSPVKLNKHEKQFVKDLENWSKQEKDLFLKDKKLFILRNQERGKGVSFFDESNFYPDFIIWLIDGKKQAIIFADPHGLRNARSFEDPKIKLSKTIKTIESDLNDPNVNLKSYILSPTSKKEIKYWENGLSNHRLFKKNNILFMYEDDNYIREMIVESIT